MTYVRPRVSRQWARVEMMEAIERDKVKVTLDNGMTFECFRIDKPNLHDSVEISFDWARS